MTERMKLEELCRDRFKKLDRAERALGVGSTEAAIFRAEWSAFDTACRIIFNERIDYFNINKP